MDVFEAVASRYSCRAFLPTPVPEATVRDIVERAARAPSAGNMQPWRIYAVAGKRVEAAEGAARAAHGDRIAERRGRRLPHLSRSDGRALSRPALRGRRTALSSPSTCRARTSRRATGNMPATIQFFGAPVGAVLRARAARFGAGAMGRHRRLSADGLLLARGHGLHTCPQQAWVSFHRTVRSFLESSRPNLMIYSGMALGYADDKRPHQRAGAPRARRFDAYASFDGFESLAETVG